MADLVLNDDQIVRRRKLYRARRLEDDERRYRSMFRFKRENMATLADTFLGTNNETRGGRLSQITRMETLLRYLADPGHQEGVGADLGCSQTGISRVVKEVCAAVVDQRRHWIKFPSTVAEYAEAEDICRQRFGRNHIPGTIGALDGCLFKILKPGVHGDVYVSGRKGYPCLNVQATCDGASRFTSVDISFPGSVHDARVYRESGLRKKLEQLGADQPYHVLADKAYSVDPQVMPAFKRNSRVPNAAAFNAVHTRQRIMIEHIFGQVKRRFPGLGNVIRIKTERIPDFIMAGCVLHNVAKIVGDDWDDVVVPDEDSSSSSDDEDPDAAERGRRARRRKRLGKAKRAQLAANIHR